MIIHNADGTTLLDLVVDDSSYFYAEVMNREDITLEFSLAEYTDIPTGAYIEWEGKTYWLLRPAEVTVVNRRNFGYKAVFETDMGKLALWRVKNTADGHVRFPLTARPSQHLRLLIDNLNAHEASPVWQAAPGSYDGPEITLSYNQTTIRDAVGQLAEACDTEWEVVRSGNAIYLSLGKVEYNASSPLPLAYGEDNGFESGVKRTNSGGGLPIEVVYVQGGDRNIDSSTYFENSTTLLLPRGQNTSEYSFYFDGEFFNGESGYEQDGRVGVAMVTDAHGHSVRLQSAARGAAEETLDLSDIYPKRIGTVSAVETEPEQPELGEIPFYNIVDDSLGTGDGKEDVDFNQCWIDGEQMTIIFQSGMLAGREISVAEDGFTLEENRGVFKLCQEKIDGFIMPGELPFIPAVGDTYAVFGCMMPEGYLRSYSTHSGAEFEMLRKAAKYLYDNRIPKQTFKGTLAKVYARKNWSTIGPKIVLGGCVSFTDEDVQSSSVTMRIMSVKRYINNPYKPEIELSNEATKGTVGSSIQTLTNNQARTERGFYDAKGYTNRRWRDAEESITMLEEAMINGFGDSISPIAVKTMGAIVGDNTLQYEFTDSAYANVVDNTPNFDASGNLVCGAGYIKHFALGFTENDYVKSNRPADEFFRWTITAASFAFTDTRPKYLYIEATKPSSKSTPGTAQYLLSPTGIPFEPTVAGDNYDTSHYYLLYATVSSVVEGTRSIATFNGFTEVTPGMIRAMKFISSDGNQYIDFINKAFKVGDADKWIGYNLNASGNPDGQGVLRLKGTMVQSPSGTTFPTPCFRGAYTDLYYYYGDLVTYQGQSWLHIGASPTMRVTPQEGAVWTLYSAKGSSGTSVLAQYSVDGSTNWHDTYADGDMYMRTSDNDGETWGDAIRIVGEDGTDGADGADGDYTDYSFSYSAALTTADPSTAPSDVTTWYDAPPAAESGKFLWVRISKMHYDPDDPSADANGYITVSTTYARIEGERGTNGVAIYKWEPSENPAPDVPQDTSYPPLASTGWYSSATTRPGDGYYLWMSIGNLDGGSVDAWSTPVRISGDKGSPGEDADDREWIYFRNTTASYGTAPASITTGEVSPGGVADGEDTDKDQADWVPNGWSDGPRGVSAQYPFEYASYRDITHDGGTTAYGAFTTPILWSHFGDRGTDGDGVEYIYVRTTGAAAPTLDSTQTGYESEDFCPTASVANGYIIGQGSGTTLTSDTCTDNPAGPDGTWVYEWVAMRKSTLAADGKTRTWPKYTGASGDYKMSLWAKYAADGAPGTTGKTTRGPSEFSVAGFDNGGSYLGQTDSGTVIDGPFIDIVSRIVDGEVKYYWCLLSYAIDPSTFDPQTDYPEDDTAHWEEFTNFSLIATKAIYAEHANFEQVTAKQFDSTDANNSGTIISGATTIINKNGNAIIKLSKDNIETSGGGGSTYYVTLYTTQNTGAPASLTIANAFNVTSAINRILIPQLDFSFEFAADALGNQRTWVGEVFIDSSPYGGTYMGYGYTSSRFSVPASYVSLSMGVHTLWARITVSDDQDRAVTTAATCTPSGNIVVTPLSVSSITELGGNGFQTFWASNDGIQGFRATANGAKVIQDGAEYAALAGGALNNLTPVKRVVLCTTLPSAGTAEDGVLYIKVTPSSNS